MVADGDRKEGEQDTYISVLREQGVEIFKKLDKATEERAELRVEVGQLKVKAGVWGMAGGLLTGIGALIILIARKIIGSG